ncbi:MAG: tRNA (5-methylaminomethyl-2-thiouridine)(34)-methyltransferase MnmD [Bacteroidota bacterium]
MAIDRLYVTDDGSHTLFSSKANENYHSTFGAIQESKHIFIEAGLNSVIRKDNDKVRILEVGTGTGLNILLAYLWSLKNNISISYQGYEPFPISKDEVRQLNYPHQLLVDEHVFSLIHDNNNEVINLSDSFLIQVNNCKIEKANLEDKFFDVVFFDAFSPSAQPELWTTHIFIQIYNSLKEGGVLTTYSCKGIVKRALKQAGFRIEKLPGPPGKREFLRAWKD